MDRYERPCNHEIVHASFKNSPHAPGGVLEIAMYITAFYDAPGEIAGICSTATDMTPWCQLQEQFFQAQKLEAVGKLSASIAHDFNNLITVIGSFCDLVSMNLPGPSPQRNDIEQIRGAAQRASTLARRMMGTARTTALVPKPIDVADVRRGASAGVTGHRPNFHSQPACSEPFGVNLATL